ncbi:MAG: hypothetical protein AAFR71_03230 [Pseudomonadota bacterium]
MIRLLGIVLLFGAVVAGGLAASAWFFPDRVDWINTPALSRSQVGYLAVSSLACLIGGAWLMGRKDDERPAVGSGASESLRLATRAVEDVRAKQAAPRKLTTENSAPKAQAASGEQQPSHYGQAPMRRENLGIPDLDGANAVTSVPPEREVTRSAKSVIKHEDGLYFEPFADFESGRVSYYQVCLRRLDDREKLPTFDRHASGSNPEHSATFDRNLIEQTIAASRQVFATLGGECHLIVPCGDALLRHDDHWRELEQLFAAQRSLTKGIIFLADAKTLSAANTLPFKRLSDLHQRGGAVACRGLDLKVDRADKEFLLDLEAVVLGLDEAFRVASTPDLANRSAISAFDFFQREKMMFLLQNIISEGDAADAIDLIAKHGSGPFFGPPRRLRDAP